MMHHRTYTENNQTISCHSFDWDWVHFLCRSSYATVDFLLKILLVAHWCFCCCWAELSQSQGHLCSPRCPASTVLRGALGGDTTRAADPEWPKKFHFVITRVKTAIKAERKEDEGCVIRSDDVHLPNKALQKLRPALLPLTGTSEWIPYLVFLVHKAFA